MVGRLTLFGNTLHCTTPVLKRTQPQQNVPHKRTQLENEKKQNHGEKTNNKQKET